jgi:hypothetical protein
MEQLDPANQKTIVDIQNERASALESVPGPSTKAQGKRKVVPSLEEDFEADSDFGGMDVDIDLGSSSIDDSGDDEEGGEENVNSSTDGAMVMDEEIMPMPQPDGIEVLRAKLHAKMAEARQRRTGAHAEAGDRDELLEQRRQQRAAMRERRRKETKEKIRKEQEVKNRKGKKSDTDQRKDFKVQGNITKVNLIEWCSSRILSFCRPSFLSQTTTSTQQA